MAGNYVEELVAFLGWEVDSKDLKSFEDQTKSVTDTIKGVAAAVGIAAAAVSAFVTITNKATAVQTFMARANEVNASTVENWGRMLSAVGGTVESVTKSFSFLNKTMGGIKSGAVSATVVEKALKGVNLELRDFQKLDTEGQYKTLLQAAKDVEDAQLGAAAATALLGRDAGKYVGYLRTQTGTIEELLAVQEKMNLQTEEGREGAIRFFGALDHLEAAADSTRESLAGLIGAGIAPLLEETRDWIAKNSELIKTKIKLWADRITKALTWLAKGIRWLITWAKQLVESMGGLENVAIIAGIAIASVISAKTLIAFVSFAKAVKAATLATTLMNVAVGLTPLLIAGVIALLFLLGEDLYQFFTGGESLLGELGEKIAEFAQMNVTPFIASLLGMTPEEFDLALVKIVSTVTRFFTQTIPALWQGMVNQVENIIAFAVNDLWPVILQIFDFYVDVWGRILKFIGGIAVRIKDTIIESVVGAIRAVSGLLKKLPGGDVLSGLLPGSGGAPSSAGLGASGAARAAAASVVNRNNTRNTGVNQSNVFNVTQLAGESGEGFARRVKDVLGSEMSRAVIATGSGVE
jgi:hypothetical protein